MRAVIQRVREASVEVDGERVGHIGRGLLVLIGVAVDDGPRQADWMVDKLLGLRIFENDAGKFDASVVDVGGAVLVVSQFTLYADTRKGRRPSFTTAAPGRTGRAALRARRRRDRRARRAGRQPGASALTWRSAWSTTAR